MVKKPSGYSLDAAWAGVDVGVEGELEAGGAALPAESFVEVPAVAAFPAFSPEASALPGLSAPPVAGGLAEEYRSLYQPPPLK